MTVHDQTYMMLYLLLIGIYFGAAYETHQRISHLWRPRTFLVYCLEICFWIFHTAIFFYLLFVMNDGELRLYFFLTCLLGLSIYQVFFSTLYQKVLEYILQGLKKSFSGFKRLIEIFLITPIRWIFRMIFALFLFLGTTLWKIVKFILKPLYKMVQALFTLLPEKTREKLHKVPRFYSIMVETVQKLVGYFKR